MQSGFEVAMGGDPFLSPEENKKLQEKNYNRLVKKYDNALKDYAREVIGEDDKHPAPGNFEYMKVRNQLRAEQRKKLEE